MFRVIVLAFTNGLYTGGLFFRKKFNVLEKSYSSKCKEKYFVKSGGAGRIRFLCSSLPWKSRHVVVVGSLGFVGDFIFNIFGQFQRKSWLSATLMEGQDGPPSKWDSVHISWQTISCCDGAGERDSGCSEHLLWLCSHLKGMEFQKEPRWMEGVESTC